MGYKYNDAIECEWVVGRYTGERAKIVAAHAATSGSYQILEEGGKGDKSFVLAASRRPKIGPTPPHLTAVVDPVMIAKLEKKRNPEKSNDSIPMVSYEEVPILKSTFEKREGE